MATIQIRDLPDDVADVLKHRAEESGQSLQTYMREQLIAMARRQTKVEAMAILERTLARDPSSGMTAEFIEESLREIRGE